MTDDRERSWWLPNEGLLAFGCELRFRHPVELGGDQWETLLALLNEASKPEPLTQYYVARERTVSRLRTFSGTLTLSRALRRGGVWRVGLAVAGASSSLANENVPNSASAVLSFVESSAEPRLASIRTNRFVSPQVAVPSAILRALQDMFMLRGEATGHIHASYDSGYVMNETWSIYAGRFQPRFPQEDTGARAQRLAPFRAAHDPRVFGAYWGTFLSASQVEALGGVLRVQREAPVAVVEVLDGGAMYLQLAPVPEPITTPAMREGLPKLEAYLAPISVPVPYFQHTASD